MLVFGGGHGTNVEPFEKGGLLRAVVLNTVSKNTKNKLTSCQVNSREHEV